MVATLSVANKQEAINFRNVLSEQPVNSNSENAQFWPFTTITTMAEDCLCYSSEIRSQSSIVQTRGFQVKEVA